MFSLFIKLHASVKYKKIDRKDIAKMLKLVKEFERFFWYGVAQVAMFDKIIYDREEMNQMRELFRKLKWLESCC